MLFLVIIFIFNCILPFDFDVMLILVLGCQTDSFISFVLSFMLCLVVYIWAFYLNICLAVVCPCCLSNFDFLLIQFLNNQTPCSLNFLIYLFFMPFLLCSLPVILHS